MREIVAKHDVGAIFTENITVFYTPTQDIVWFLRMNIKFLLAHGSRDTKINTPDQSYEGITWAEIGKMVQEPQCVEKENAAFIIPSEYRAHDGRTHEVQREKGIYHALVLDIDDGNHDLNEVQDAVRNRWGLYSHHLFIKRGIRRTQKMARVYPTRKAHCRCRIL